MPEENNINIPAHGSKMEWGFCMSHTLLTLIQERLKPTKVISNFFTDFYKDK